MNILCVCPIGIGNYLMCYPAFAALRKKRPGDSLHLLALRHAIAAIAEGDQLWNGIHVFDPDKVRTNFGEPARVLARLRSIRFDASVNFFPSNTWQYFAFPALCGIPRRYGFRYRRRHFSTLSFLATDALAVDTSLHDVIQNLRLTEFYCGESLKDEPYVFPRLFSEEDSQWSADFCRSVAGNAKLIALHPGSSIEHGMDVKRWPADRFAQLADKACEATGAHAMVIGSAQEADIKQAVATSMKTNVHLVEPISLRKTAALLSKCTWSICNDSGIMHLAACAGVPTAGIFGPTDEKRNGPFGRQHLVIRKPMPGFPMYTAENVGDRSTPKGIDPQAALLALTAEDAWQQLGPWLNPKVC